MSSDNIIWSVCVWVCVRSRCDHSMGLGLTLGSHSCLFQTPPTLLMGPASCPTRKIMDDTPEVVAAFSRSCSAMYLDSP